MALERVPADDTSAAIENIGDFGTSRWLLSGNSTPLFRSRDSGGGGRLRRVSSCLSATPPSAIPLPETAE